MYSGFTGRGLIWACPNARRPNGIRHGVAKRDPTQAGLQLIGAGCEPSRCANTPHRRAWRCAHHLRVCSAVCSSRDHSLERSRRAEYDRPTTFATLVPGRMAMSGGFHRRAAAHRRNETRALRLMSNVEVKSGTGPTAKKGAHVGGEIWRDVGRQFDRLAGHRERHGETASGLRINLDAVPR